jgi:hypothetical protein
VVGGPLCARAAAWRRAGARRTRRRGHAPARQAKLAEEAERYEDMVNYVKQLAELKVQLNVEERNLLSVAYKNVVGARRASWRVLSSIESKEKEKGDTDKVGSITEYRKKVRSCAREHAAPRPPRGAARGPRAGRRALAPPSRSSRPRARTRARTRPGARCPEACAWTRRAARGDRRRRGRARACAGARRGARARTSAALAPAPRTRGVRDAVPAATLRRGTAMRTRAALSGTHGARGGRPRRRRCEGTGGRAAPRRAW